MKTIKIILISLIAWSTLFSVQAKKHALRSVKGKPNVIVIYTDDHRYTGVHALGGMAVRTPNLDNLAHNGIAFTHTYLMGAMLGATCIPSRAMLHTGRNLFELEGPGYSFGEGNTSMGQAFKEAGYYSYQIGKWHQDTKDLPKAFNHGAKLCGKPAYLTDQFRMPYSDWKDDGIYKREDAYLLEYDEKGDVKRRPLSKDDKRGPTATEKDGPHVSKVLADEAVEFISGYDKKQPYFIYLAFPCPHDPRQAPQKYHDMYPVNDIALTPSYMPQHPFDNGHQILRDEQLAPWPRTKAIAKKHLADYYAIITHLDAQIGRVIKALKESGAYDNTIVVMAGDSGLGVGNHGLMGKQNVYDEDGIHVPFIISGGLIDEKDKGRREDAFCYIHDIFPTVCDLAGIQKPASVTGKSLAPVISGEQNDIRDYTYHAYRQYMRAYRKGDYKLIEYVKAPEDDMLLGKSAGSGSRTTQLFNFKKDRWETFNLAYLPEYKDILKQMRSEMRAKALLLHDKPDGIRTKFDFWNYYE